MYDAALTFLIRVSGAAAAFVLQALLARLMGLSDFGSYVLVWTWLLTIGSVATLGFAESAIRFAPRYEMSARSSSLVRFFAFGMLMIVAFSGGLAGLGILMSLLLPLGTHAMMVLFFVALALPFLAIEYFLDSIARALGWFRITSIIIYLIRPLAIAAVCLLLYRLGVRLTAPVVCTVVVGLLIATNLAAWLIIRTRIAHMSKGGDRNPEQQRIWLKASTPMLVVATLDDMMLNGDVALVGFLLAPEAAAVYFIASRVLVLAALAQYALYFVYGRTFSKAVAARDPVTLRREFWRSTIATVVATIAAVALTVVATPVLLKIFGSDYDNAFTLVLILSLSFIARSISGQAHELLMIMGRQQPLTLINTGSIILGVLLIALMVRTMHIEGAAIAMAIVTALRATVLLALAHRAVNFHQPSAPS